jgi:hypothetical protein
MIKLPMKPLTKVVFVFVLVVIVIVWLFIILGIFITFVDDCSELICTVGYPCFDQGDCSNRSWE